MIPETPTKAGEQPVTVPRQPKAPTPPTSSAVVDRSTLNDRWWYASHTPMRPMATMAAAEALTTDGARPGIDAVPQPPMQQAVLAPIHASPNRLAPAPLFPVTVERDHSPSPPVAPAPPAVGASGDSGGPVVHIETLEVRVVPPTPPQPVVTRPVDQGPATPLARLFTSSFGFRQE
jgi:hypothetical protein